MSHQIEMVSLESLVCRNHQYRKFIGTLDFTVITDELLCTEKDAAYKGYGVLRLFKCLLLQFIEHSPPGFTQLS